MPGRLAREIVGSALTIRELPFAPQRFDWCMYWHRRHGDNQAIRWLRDQIRAVGLSNGKRSGPPVGVQAVS
jgi:DNA-binding transcriptional LysR family regulator